MGQITGRCDFTPVARSSDRAAGDALGGSVDSGPITEIGDEGDAELSAGLHELEHDVAGLAAIGAHRAARDPALGHAGPQVVLGGIGVEQDLGPLQHLQQFVLSPVQAGEQLAQFMIAGALPEDLVEALGKDRSVHSRRLLLPELQIAVKSPDLVSGRLQLARLLRCFRYELLPGNRTVMEATI